MNEYILKITIFSIVLFTNELIGQVFMSTYYVSGIVLSIGNDVVNRHKGHLLKGST